MISLFVRSYEKDFTWLSHSVKSMRKNLKGTSDRVLCVPLNTKIPNDISVYFNRIVYIPEILPGYLQQQIDKVAAYKYCQHENILFSDSDCIYFQEFDATQMLEGNKIRLWQTRYSSLAHIKDVIRWRDITRLCTGVVPDWEYMRCFPIMHKAKVCKYLDELHQYQQYLKIVKDHNLSEFNALGAIAKTYYPSDYIFLDTEVTLPSVIARQYWSWGGITPDISKELETV